MVGTGVMLQVGGTKESQVREMGATPLVEKKAMIQVGETEETPQVEEKEATPQAAGTDAMPQVAEMQVIPQVVGTSVMPPAVGMWVILQVVGTEATPQVGAAVASPRLGGPAIGVQVGPLLSLVVWLHIAGAPVPWVA